MGGGQQTLMTWSSFEHVLNDFWEVSLIFSKGGIKKLLLFIQRIFREDKYSRIPSIV